jgi:hypothetical protein
MTTTTCLFEEWILADTTLTFGEWLDAKASAVQNVSPDYGPRVANYIGPTPDKATQQELARILGGTFTNKWQKRYEL